ncbi:MAG: hypothetical protein NTW93_04040 [Phycisphaerae bacterium]|nr:hypothetical protein [Phycisphaerae bacterium]
MPDQGPVTEETIACTIEQSHRFRGSFRVSTGLIWTTQDYERRRKDTLSRPLP